MGRPPHQPTQETREKVRALVVAGVLQDDIAKVLGIAPQTLRKWYRDELDNGLAEACANVANTLLHKALNGDTAAAIFFLKARAKWSEKVQVQSEVSGDVGLTIEVVRFTGDG